MEEQPGATVIVVLIIAFVLLFPQDACRGRTTVARPEIVPTRFVISPSDDASAGESDE